MNISISGRHLTVRQDLKNLIEKKLAKFDKFFPGGADASATCRCERDDKIIEITITVGSTIFRAEKRSDTFQSALDMCLSSIERQIRKNKTRLEKRMKASLTVPDDVIADDHIEEEIMFDIRKKAFPIRPMTVEEAIMQMNLIGHTFYMFLDAESSKMCVVYKRHGDTYGLIVPEE
ncbi:MAG: ribosome-associated translation inhibitor RaiA [Clostridiales bacterium]|nr:ribosome-associated translation inhibitor RaiA [Clostridiales bacterium]